jgi:hypothetical protein
MLIFLRLVSRELRAEAPHLFEAQTAALEALRHPKNPIEHPATQPEH